MENLVFYCAACNKLFVGEDYHQFERPKCPNCRKATVSTGVTKEEWLRMTKVERDVKLKALTGRSAREDYANENSISYLDRLYTHTLTGVTPVGKVTATATYGIGLLTGIVLAFCNLFGCECEMYTNKVEKAEYAATVLLKTYADNLGADGVMDIRYQVYGTTVFISGTAYKQEASQNSCWKTT